MARHVSFVAKFLALVAAMILVQAPTASANALPLLPNFPPILCSVADGPWCLCDQSNVIDGEAIPDYFRQLYDFVAMFTGGGDGGGGSARKRQL